MGEQLELAAHKRNSNTEEGSARNIGYHYDAGNAFYKLFLDRTITGTRQARLLGHSSTN